MGEVVDQIGLMGTPQETSQVAAADRRRPGRAEVSQSLLPLLRSSTESHDPPLAIMDIETRADADEDALAPARGIAFGLLLSVPLWVVIAAIVALLTR